jgi:hypothetical protein
MTENPTQPYEAFERTAADNLFGFLIDSHSCRMYCAVAYHTLYSLILETTPSPNLVNIRTRTAQIRLHGRNLAPLIGCVSARTCVSITEFVPSVHLPPPHNAPFIERIEVLLHSHYN